MLPEHSGPSTSIGTSAPESVDDTVAQLLAELVAPRDPPAPRRIDEQRTDQQRTDQQHIDQQHIGQTQLLPLLHAITHRFGRIDDAHIRALAHALNLSRAEVFGVVTFYDDFTQVARVTPTIEVCAAEACQARGADALLRATQGRADVRAVYCLGNCASGPSVRVGDHVHARMTMHSLTALLAQSPASQHSAARSAGSAGSAAVADETAS